MPRLLAVVADSSSCRVIWSEAEELEDVVPAGGDGLPLLSPVGGSEVDSVVGSTLIWTLARTDGFEPLPLLGGHLGLPVLDDLGGGYDAVC